MSELSDRLDTMGLTIKAVHIGLCYETTTSGTEAGKPTGWDHDLWSVTITRTETRAAFETSFKTGLGARRLAPFTKHENGQYFDQTRAIVTRDIAVAARKDLLLPPKTLDIADVLYSCFADASGAASSTFEDWCSDFSLDTDSRKALDSYLECQRTYVKLSRLLGSRAKVDELARLEH